MGIGGTSMAKVLIDENVCKGCGLCIAACPKKLLKLASDRINPKGYNPAELSDARACLDLSLIHILAWNIIAQPIVHQHIHGIYFTK